MEKKTGNTVTCYKLANGKTISIVVSVEVKQVLEETDPNRLAKNQARKDRRNDVHILSTDYIDATIAASKGDLADLLAEMEDQMRLKAAISALPPVQRRRLLLHHIEGLTYQEIADKERVRVNSIAKSIGYAVRSLRKLIKV